jgi:hypothetical protein
MPLPPEVEEYLRKNYGDIPASVLSGPKVGPPPPEFVAAQDADAAAREDAQRQAVLGSAANAFAGRGFRMPERVAPINENVRRYLEQQQAARAATIDPMEAIKRAMDIRKGNLDASKTGAEIGKLGAETGKIGVEIPQVIASTAKTAAETPGAAADSAIKKGLAGPVTPAAQAVAKEYGFQFPPQTTEEGARTLLKQLDDAKKLEAQKGEKAKNVTTDLRKEFQGNQVYKDAQQIASSHEKVRTASPTPAGDIALVYGFMKILDPGSAVREGEYATAANAGGAFAKLGNVYNSLLKGDKLPQSVRDALKAEATTTYQAQMKRYESLAEPYRGLARKSGANPEDVVLPFVQPDEAPAAPSAPAADPATSNLRKKYGLE